MNDNIQVKSSVELATKFDYDLLVEASPFSSDKNSVPIQCIEAAFLKGKAVVLANKSPLVTSYDRILALAEKRNCKLSFSATVCGGLPVVNVGQRDLHCASITKVYGVFNGTSNFILTEVMNGKTVEEATKEAQRRGIAETNPELDSTFTF